jgi:hypothetical protein
MIEPSFGRCPEARMVMGISARLKAIGIASIELTSDLLPYPIPEQNVYCITDRFRAQT